MTTHVFRDGLERPATRHINPDRSPGGWVAGGARVGVNVFIGLDAEVLPGAVIGYDTRIGAGATIGYDARVGAKVIIGDGASINDSAVIGWDARIGSDAVVPPCVRIGDAVCLDAGEWWQTMSPVGSFGATLTAVARPEGLRWWVGSAHNLTTEELRDRVLAAYEAGSADREDYLHVIHAVASHPRALGVTS